MVGLSGWVTACTICNKKLRPVAFFRKRQRQPQAGHRRPRTLWCANILWPSLLAAGAIPNIAYCLYLMRNRRFTTRYSGEGLLYCWSLSVLMGLLWFGGHVLYGMGISSLGALGPTLGWPVYMSFLVISAGLYGFATGEWKQVTNGPIGLQLAGMAILCVAVFIFSRARP